MPDALTERIRECHAASSCLNKRASRVVYPSPLRMLDSYALLIEFSLRPTFK